MAALGAVCGLGGILMSVVLEPYGDCFGVLRDCCAALYWYGSEGSYDFDYMVQGREGWSKVIS